MAAGARAIPSPPPTSAGRSRNMAAIRRRDTLFERQIRSLLHAAGLRFRVDFPIRVPGTRLIRPDIVFTKRRVAVFCDGCFWHGCPEHGQRPGVRNGDYWLPKIAGNRERDERQTQALRADGWTVLRFWEHEDPALIAGQIAGTVRELG